MNNVSLYIGPSQLTEAVTSYTQNAGPPANCWQNCRNCSANVQQIPGNYKPEYRKRMADAQISVSQRLGIIDFENII